MAHEIPKEVQLHLAEHNPITVPRQNKAIPAIVGHKYFNANPLVFNLCVLSSLFKNVFPST